MEYLFIPVPFCRTLLAVRSKNDELILRSGRVANAGNQQPVGRQLRHRPLFFFPRVTLRARRCFTLPARPLQFADHSRTSQNVDKDDLLREWLTRRRAWSPGTCCCTAVNRASHPRLFTRDQTVLLLTSRLKKRYWNFHSSDTNLVKHGNQANILDIFQNYLAVWLEYYSLQHRDIEITWETN